ncbi:MAG: MBL fold metallo-hydrolase [Actinobacteria bacterium]|nr:MBL fold metallo-hydrolase [Actinomycetota bacterium]
MRLHRTESEDYLSNAYLLDDEAGTGVLIDGNGVPGPLLEQIERERLTVPVVLLTHHHVDHVRLDGYRELGARVLAHPLTAQELPDGSVDETLTDGQRIEQGALAIECLHTPGHAHGHLAFLVDGTDVFTADVLFAGTVGGTRAPQATGLADLRASLERLLALPGETRVRPGHRAPTTIARERRENPFVRALLDGEAPAPEPCTVAGEPATLLLWGPDYDGTHKAWVRLADGTEHVTGGSQVGRGGA